LVRGAAGWRTEHFFRGWRGATRADCFGREAHGFIVTVRIHAIRTIHLLEFRRDSRSSSASTTSSTPTRGASRDVENAIWSSEAPFACFSGAGDVVPWQAAGTHVALGDADCAVLHAMAVGAAAAGALAPVFCRVWALLADEEGEVAHLVVCWVLWFLYGWVWACLG
jgi:hypothetical protein